MNDRTPPRASLPAETRPRRHGPGVKLLVLAMMLVAIAAAVDIAWMRPGAATMPSAPPPAVAQDANDNGVAAGNASADDAAPVKAAARTADTRLRTF